MALRPVDARVLACLIEKEITVPDSYPLTSNALRSACNQSSNRNPVTSYDGRTIDDALVALKSVGLVRFVHPSHGGRTLRYRHVADERWELGRGELGVLAMLILRGPETVATLRARAEKHLAEGGVSAEEALDALMARHPDPFVDRLPTRPGEREPRYTQLLVDDDDHTETGDAPSDAEDDPTATVGQHAIAPVVEHATAPVVEHATAPVVERATVEREPEPMEAPESQREDLTDLAALVEALIDEVADLRGRIERLEN